MNLTLNQQTLTEYYIAAFGRVPDQGGLDYWTGRLEGTIANQSQLTVEQIRDAFFDRNIPEVAQRFPINVTNEELVTSIYQNIFSREADVGGLNYWIGRLEGTIKDNDNNFLPALGENELLTYMLAAAKEADNDALTLANKLEITDYFLNTIPIDMQNDKNIEIVDLDAVSNFIDSISSTKITIDAILHNDIKILSPLNMSEVEKLYNLAVAAEVGLLDSDIDFIYNDEISWRDNYIKYQVQGIDFEDTINTTAIIDMSSPVTGNLQYKSDKDWFKVDLELGKDYKINLEGIDTSKGTLYDPYLYGLYDSNGNLINTNNQGNHIITTNDDNGPYTSNNGYPNYNASVTLTDATQDATYFVSVGAFSNNYTGTYTLSIVEIA